MNYTLDWSEAAEWVRAFALILRNEGGYLSPAEAERIGDPGGETNFGITARTLRALGYPWTPRDLTPRRARLVYSTHYWAPMAKLPAGVRTFAFDYGVQTGPRLVIARLQQLVGAKRDGVAGPQTAAAVAAYGVSRCTLRFASARRDFLVRWARRDARRAVMVRGLMARVDRAESVALGYGLD